MTDTSMTQAKAELVILDELILLQLHSLFIYSFIFYCFDPLGVNIADKECGSHVCLKHDNI